VKVQMVGIGTVLKRTLTAGLVFPYDGEERDAGLKQ